MNTKRFAFITIPIAVGLAFILAGCDEEARVASENLRTAADNFQVMRRITVLNTRSGQPSLMIEGACSQEGERMVRVICKMPNGTYRKTIISAGESDTVLSEQLEPIAVDGYRYMITINPSEILPRFQLR